MRAVACHPRGRQDAETRAGALEDAAKSGDVDLVLVLLDEGADINEAGSFGTPLHLAVLNDHAKVVAVLAERGADLNALSDLLGTPLHTAAQRDRPAPAGVLLEHGASTDARNKENHTPLQTAAKLGSTEVARVLIDGGADVTVISVGAGGNNYKLGEQTALHLALQSDKPEIAEMLRAAGAGPMPVPPADAALAGADVEQGREHAQTYCRTCHAIEAGDPPPAAFDHGPPLIGIVGEPVARDAAFAYSDALRAFGGDWTDDRLYAFVYRPMLTVPGTLMGHQLVKKPEETADIVAYLISLPE